LQGTAILTKGEIIMKTIVCQLGTNNEYIYTVPPEIAVVNAYYQYGKHDYNTWEYDYSLVRYSVSARTVYCGDFAAKAE
jgi:hypothetical protein